MREGAKLQLARRLRKDMTHAERALWQRIRQQQTGHRFRRQHPIGPYVVDFVCIERRLVIEVDGGQHGGVLDHRRDIFLDGQGYAVVRFWNNEVLQNMEGVLQVIMERLSLTCPHPNLPPRAGEGAERP